MKHLLAIACALLVSFPTPLLAQDLGMLTRNQPALEFVEKPVTTTCGDAKCLDFENFKLYLQMRAQYVWLFKHHTATWPGIQAELKKSTELYEKAAAVHAENAARWEKGYNELFPKYEDAVLRAEKAEAHSVWGGGLPWLVTATVTGFAAGVAVTLWIKP